jgi:perosamine synthetase
MRINLSRPTVTEEMVEAAAQALRDERLVLGESVYRFEEAFARYIGTDHAVSVSSGTAALTLSLIALNARGREVITTPLSFIATANSIVHAGGRPRFADVSDDCLISVEKVREAFDERSSAIMPVHLFGFPCDMDGLLEVSEEHGLNIVEDAAQAHGAEYKGRKVGSFGNAGCFSFYSTKNMTVGGDGGMVTTNDERLAEELRKLRDCGRVSRYVHDVFGYTARLNTVNAAFGLAQLRHLDDWNERRRELAALYGKRLMGLETVSPPNSPSKEIRPVFHLYAIRCRERDELAKHLMGRGVEVGVHYPVPIHLQPVYREAYGYREGGFPVSEGLSRRLLSLPMFPSLTEREVDYVCEGIWEFYGGSA